MPRTPRVLRDDQPTVYHVISRTCLPGFPLGSREKDFLLKLLHRNAAIYFIEMIGFCLMGNHFHLLVRVQPSHAISDEELLERYQAVFGTDAAPTLNRLNEFRAKWTSLSEYMREIKQTFSRYYNRIHNRRGYFWGDRFKSLIVEDGRTLVNCLAYIDLNPIRAGIARRPEEYRWCSLGYHLGTNNAGGLLSLDFGLADWDVPEPDRLRFYREFVYRTGALERDKGAISQRILDRAEAKDFEYTQVDRFTMRTRWFTCGTILGSREFVADIAHKLGLPGAGKRRPKRIAGLEGMYSFRRLSELL